MAKECGHADYTLNFHPMFWCYENDWDNDDSRATIFTIYKLIVYSLLKASFSCITQQNLGVQTGSWKYY